MNIEEINNYADLFISLSIDFKIGKITKEHYENVLELTLNRMFEKDCIPKSTIEKKIEDLEREKAQSSKEVNQKNVLNKIDYHNNLVHKITALKELL